MIIQHEGSQTCLQAILPFGHEVAGTTFRPLEPWISLGQQRPLKITTPALSALDRHIFHQIRLLKSSLNLALNLSRGIHKSSGKPVAMSHSALYKIFPYVQSKSTFFNFQPAGHTSCDVAQAIADFLGCKCSFLSPFHQDSLVLHHRVVLNLLLPQSALIFQIVLNPGAKTCIQPR